MTHILVNVFWHGLLITLQVTVFSAILGTAVSILSGLAGLSPYRAVRSINLVYVEFFRGASVIIELFWIFFALPLLGITLSPLVAGVVALGLNMGSYGSEIVRGAVLAVPKGQYEASIALDLTSFQRMRYVVFPQAVRIMLPPYGNLLIELLKGTALVSLITLSDATFETMKLRANGTASTLTLFSLLLVLYFAVALLITTFVRSLERFFGRGQETRVSGPTAGRRPSLLRLPRFGL